MKHLSDLLGLPLRRLGREIAVAAGSAIAAPDMQLQLPRRAAMPSSEAAPHERAQGAKRAELNPEAQAPDLLELEITESMMMAHPERAAETLLEIREMGVHLSIDDFGTGYSSLSRLKKFPIDSVKIDRSFIGDVANDADDAAIVSAVIAMAHNLRLTVVAEGVETVEQIRFLRERKCDEIQGYLVSRPMTAEQVGEFAARGHGQHIGEIAPA